MPDLAGERPEADALLEREDELSRIQAAIDRAARGHGELLMVEGQAGIGKTSLLRAAEAIAAEREMTVLCARATELEREFPFGAIRQLLERPVGSLSESGRAQVLAGAALGAAAVLGFSTDDDHRPAEPGSTYLGLYWTIANLSEPRPLVITLDDAQWADPDSLRALAFIAPRLGDLPVLLMLATREQDWDGADLFAATASDPATNALRPRQLSAAASAEIAAAAYDEEVSPGFAAACHRATQGNPFYLRSLLDELRRDGVAPTEESASRVMALGPRAVGQAIVARLAQLSAGARVAVRAAAVLEDGATLRLTAQLAEIDPNEMPAIAGELVRAGVLEPGGSGRIAHPIVRNAVYTDLGPAERDRLHRRAVELLGGDGPQHERIAPHLLALEPAGDPRVVDGLRSAARRAIAHGAFASAVAQLRRALAEPPAREQRRELHAELGMAALMVDGEAAVEHLGAALELTSQPEGRAELTGALQSGLLYAARRPEAIALLRDEHERELNAGSERAAALLEAQLIVALATSTGGDLEEADARLERLGRDGPGHPPEPLALAALAFRRLQRGAPSEQVVQPARAALEGISTANPTTVASVLVHAVGVLLRCDQLDLATAWAERAMARAGSSAFALSLANWLLACVARRAGDLDDAIAGHQTALRQAREFGTPEGVASALTGLIDAQVERGALNDAEAELEATGFARALPGAGVAEPEFLVARARLRLAHGDPETALTDLALARSRFEDRGAPGPGMGPWRSTEALALLRIDERERALALSAEELELARVHAVPSVLAIALMAAAAVEGGEREELLLREAVDTVAGTPVRLEHARALVALGSAIRRGGRRADARDPLRRGLELARECGAIALVERAYDELRATGARPRKILYTGVDALTPSERRVAELAASGQSNREIAQELFLSTKTVEFHLGQCYRKLAIQSRKELAGALRDA